MQFDFGGLENKHFDVVRREGKRVVEALQEPHLHDSNLADRILESLGDTRVADGRRVVPELHGDQSTSEKEIKHLVVLDAVLAHKAMSVEDDRDEHVARELVDVEQVQQDDEELVQRVSHLPRRVCFEVRVVVLFDP